MQKYFVILRYSVKLYERPDLCKNSARKVLILLLTIVWLTISGTTVAAQAPAAYTSVYNGTLYSSPRPYNLTIIYFVAKDVPLDTTYPVRLSAILLAGQEFYRQNMVDNGYGSKTFGLMTEAANPANVKIVLINGQQNASAYTYNNPSKLKAEVDAYLASNPSQQTSEHTLIISAVADINNADVPFYGVGKTCYALDYTDFDINYIGQSTPISQLFSKWYGGMMHELGHGLNLPHSQETRTEHSLYGTTLMSYGNVTLGQSPTFQNRAACAILNNCQVFADAPGKDVL